jgi:hypothetical protein
MIIERETRRRSGNVLEDLAAEALRAVPSANHSKHDPRTAGPGHQAGGGVASLVNRDPTPIFDRERAVEVGEALGLSRQRARHFSC